MKSQHDLANIIRQLRRELFRHEYDSLRERHGETYDQELDREERNNKRLHDWEVETERLIEG